MYPGIIPGDTKATARRLLAASAVCALLAGTSIYLLDRDWATVLFLAPFAEWQPGETGIYGTLGYTLPSFFHAYAFALLLILVMRPARHAPLFGALTWLAIASIMETLQGAPVRALILESAAIPAGVPVLGDFQSYVVHGSFDGGDLMATGFGCLVAFLAATIAESKH